MSRNILIGTGLLLCCISPTAPYAAGCVTFPDSAKIAEVGAFSNMRYTDEHAYGYSVMLWRARDCLLGLLQSSQGLAGDTPIGELQDVKYDNNTGHLSFSAKLTTGVVSVRGSGGMEPSRDLLAFDGALKANTLTGVMTCTLRNDPNPTSTHTDVVLGLSKVEAEFMHGSTTHGEWLRQWQPILQRRGPKW